MTPAIAFRLGRVSNLPTVWTNTIAGAALAGGVGLDLKLALMLIAMSMFYIGGMFLNDAYDAQVDAAERPERPIPSGAVSRSEVFRAGYWLLGAAILLLLGIGAGEAFQPGTDGWPVLGGLLLAAAIVAYNRNHKDNPISPFVMGLCRVMVYFSAAWCMVTVIPIPVIVIAALALCHLIGLTYIAKQENLGQVHNLWPLLFFAIPILYGLWHSLAGWAVTFWLLYCLTVAYALRFLFRRHAGDIPRAVVTLIAAISLLDAMLVALAGHGSLAVLCVLAFALTLLLQRFVPGT